MYAINLTIIYLKFLADRKVNGVDLAKLKSYIEIYRFYILRPWAKKLPLSLDFLVAPISVCK